MAFVKLIVISPGRASRELRVETEVVAIGRALDNTISLEQDSNVSRYHAEIEKRGEEFWIVDLGSSNGTTVNDVPVEFEHPLSDGDLIGIGGSTIIEFHLSYSPWLDPEEHYDEAPPFEPAPASAPQTPPVSALPVSAPAVSVPAVSAPATSAPAVGSSALADATTTAHQPLPAAPPATGLSPLLLVGAVGGGLLLTGVVAAAIYFAVRPGACKATVRITSPQTGTTIKGPVTIRVEAEETKCIDRVIYQLDGTKVASSEIPPYNAVLDPADLSGLTAGNHVLTVTIEDDKGNRRIQPEEIVLGFERAQITTPENNDGAVSSPSPVSVDHPIDGQGEKLSAADIKEMCDKLAKEVAGKNQYILDRELLHQVEARTADYAVGGFYSRARPFRDVINDSFINEQGLEPPLGYVMAMSRSSFNLAPSRSNAISQGEGLWQIPLPLAQNAGYLGRCGTATLSEQTQKCAAMVAAAYMKSLVVDLFGGDSLLAVSCFGLSPKEAAQWRDQLPPDRSDLWKVINSAEQRERLTRFLAAGIVGENPQRFGLVSDSPLSNLYPKK
jgi:FHA domain/Bacterial Ig domain